MAVDIIPIPQLALAFVPVAMVIVLLWTWRLRYGQALYAIARMLLQLLAIGYVLVYVFAAESGVVIALVLTLMVAIAGWIALNTLEQGRAALYLASLLSIAVVGGLTLWLVTQGVLRLDPWYRPSYMVPLAGMIFAGSMNAISLAVERLHSEMRNGHTFDAARQVAFRAAMIPVTNSLFAVGLISLPGMMTGQILSGVDPFIAARYQIVVMCMLFGAAGLSAALFLFLIRRVVASSESFVPNLDK